MSPWIITGALLLAIGLGGAGYVKGGADNEAKHIAALSAERQRTLDAVAAQAAEETLRLAAEQKSRLLAQALEDQAYAEPVESPACLPVSRVLRLNKR